MSNQQYRKEEPEVPTREARLAQARAKLDSVAIAKPSAGEKLDTARKIMFKEAGGHLLDLQIEGMSLVRGLQVVAGIETDDSGFRVAGHDAFAVGGADHTPDEIMYRLAFLNFTAGIRQDNFVTI